MSDVNPVTTTVRTQRCQPCGGSGLIEAGGFVKKDCTACNGSGTIKIIEADIEVLLAKSTEHYQTAKNRIKAIDPSITDKEAEDLLDEQLKSTNREDDGKGKGFHETKHHSRRPSKTHGHVANGKS